MTNVDAGDKKKDYNDKRPLIIANRVIIKGQIISMYMQVNNVRE
jgi:hypothetical protein